MKHAAIATKGRRRALGVPQYIGLVLISLLFPFAVTEAHSDSYVVRIRERGIADQYSLSLPCTDSENRPCRGEFSLSDWGKGPSVRVTCLFFGGDVFVSFQNENSQLLADGFPLVHISLNERGKVHRNITLTEPMPAVRDDLFDLAHRYAPRGRGKILAFLTIEIRQTQ